MVLLSLNLSDILGMLEFHEYGDAEVKGAIKEDEPFLYAWQIHHPLPHLIESEIGEEF